MGAISDLFATQTPTPYAVPIADGSGLLDAWVSGSGGFVNPMTDAEDLIVGGIAGTPTRLAKGYVGQVLTVGSGGYLDWEAPTGGFTNPMTQAEDLIVGGVAGAPTRLGHGYVGQVLTVGSGGYLDWENVNTNIDWTRPGTIGSVTPNTGAFTTLSATGAIDSGAVSGTTGALKFHGLTSGVVTLSVADAAGTWTMKLPTSAGSSGLILSTDGAGNCTWVSQSGVSDYLALQVFF